MSALRVQYSLCFCFVILLSSACGGARPAAELAKIEQRRLWSHDFDNPIVFLQLTQNGWLHTLTFPDGDAKEAGTRTLLDETGAVVWSGPEATTTLLATASVVVIEQEKAGSRHLFGFDTKGEELWRTPPLPDVVLAGVVVEDLGLLVVLTAGVGAVPEETVEAPIVVRAIALSTGEERWSQPLGTAKVSRSMSLDAVATKDETLWVALDGLVAAIEVPSGTLKFGSPLGGLAANEGAWTFGQGWAYLLSRGSVVGFDSTGERWRTALVATPECYPIGLLSDGDDLLVELLTAEQLEVARLKGQSGEVEWRQELPRDKVLYGMALGQGRLVVGLDDELMAFDAKAGTKVWARELDDFDTMRMVIGREGHGVLAGAEAVEAFSFADGSTLWRRDGFHDVVAWRAEQVRQGAAAAASVANSGSNYDEIVSIVGTKITVCDFSNCRGETTLYYRYNAEAEAEDLAEWESTFAMVSSAAAIPLYTSDQRADSQYYKLNRLLDPDRFSFTPGGEANAAVVDLDTGVVTEGGVPETGAACIPILLIDSVGRKVVHAARQEGLGCTDEAHLDVYRFDVP